MLQPRLFRSHHGFDVFGLGDASDFFECGNPFEYFDFTVVHEGSHTAGDGGGPDFVSRFTFEGHFPYFGVHQHHFEDADPSVESRIMSSRAAGTVIYGLFHQVILGEF